MSESIALVREYPTSRLQSVIDLLEKTTPLVRWYNLVGIVVFSAMVLLTFCDVILRYVFNSPIDGSIEITELMMVVVVFSSLVFTETKDAHVNIDILTASLKTRGKKILEGITLLFSMLIFFVIIWRSFSNAFDSNQTTSILNIPIKYVAFLIPLSCALLVMVLLKKFLKVIQYGLKEDNKILPWIFIAPLIVCVSIFFILYNHPWDIDLPIIGVMGILGMFVLFALGMPVAYSLFAAGFVFLSYLRGFDAALEIMGKSWYETAGSYPWSPLMFFLLMGYICFYCQIGSDLFKMANRFIGHVKGGLTMAAVVACAAFGAVVGDTISGSVAMTAIGLPEMRRYNYKDSLSIGTLTTAGTLGSLIPPSLGFIIYGLLAEQSVGDLFIAGIIPGLISAGFFILFIFILTKINPGIAPASEKANWGERFNSIKATWPTASLFVLVIGGIYAGIFTATEGGGIGSFGAVFICLLMGRFKGKQFIDSFTEATKFIAMMFTILGGANIFGYFVSMSDVPYFLANVVSALAVSPALVLMMIVAVFFVLGCFLPAIPMVLICVPIFLPMAKAFDWNLIWFGVIIVYMLNLAGVTPPFGINLFVIKGVTKVEMSFMYKAVMPFVLCLLFGLVIVMVFPSASVWLPNLLH